VGTNEPFVRLPLLLVIIDIIVADDPDVHGDGDRRWS
jgi:hypothetical protein